MPSTIERTARTFSDRDLRVILGLNLVIVLASLGAALLGFDWSQALRLTPFGPPGPILVGM